MFYSSNFQQSESVSATNMSCHMYDADETGGYPLHCHYYYEISYVRSGKRFELLNSSKWEAKNQSLFFIKPMVLHGVINITPVQDLVIQFSPYFLRSLSPSFEKTLLLVPENTAEPFIDLSAFPQLVELMETLCELLCLNQNNHERKNIILSELKKSDLVLKLIYELIQIGFLNIVEEDADDKNMYMLYELINTIINHPEHIPDMTEAAAKIGMGYSSFSRFFKKTTGLNYNDYCNSLRLQYAEYLLITTEDSIQSIAESIGIYTQSYFTRAFKKRYKMSPSDYRRKYR